MSPSPSCWTQVPLTLADWSSLSVFGVRVARAEYTRVIKGSASWTKCRARERQTRRPFESKGARLESYPPPSCPPNPPRLTRWSRSMLKLLTLPTPDAVSVRVRVGGGSSLTRVRLGPQKGVNRNRGRRPPSEERGRPSGDSPK